MRLTSRAVFVPAGAFTAARREAPARSVTTVTPLSDLKAAPGGGDSALQPRDTGEERGVKRIPLPGLAQWGVAATRQDKNGARMSCFAMARNYMKRLLQVRQFVVLLGERGRRPAEL